MKVSKILFGLAIAFSAQAFAGPGQVGSATQEDGVSCQKLAETVKNLEAFKLEIIPGSEPERNVTETINFINQSLMADCNYK
ncbi:MAG: hypothetical protein J7501_01335 [Bdellovibrio sp.]|nr:hypothetical protein [Bdellovibrio sp.]